MNLTIVIISLGILVALHEAGHFWIARSMGMKVIRFSIGFFHPILKWTSAKTGITYQIGALPLGGFVEIKGMNPFEEGAFEDTDSYQTKSPWKRALVIVAGPLANLLIAFSVLFLLLTVSGLPEDTNESRLGSVVSGGPASNAGLQKDDRILAVDGVEIGDWSALAKVLHESPGKRLTLTVQRDGRGFFVPVMPLDVDGTGLIGIGPPTKNISLPPLDAAIHSAAWCYRNLADTFINLRDLITGAGDNVSAVGPPGIVKMGSAYLEAGSVYFFKWLAYISLMLFLFNLLPIPALDGGRTVFLLYELITRRRVNKKFDATLNTAFFFLFMALILFISIKELVFK